MKQPRLERKLDYSLGFINNSRCALWSLGDYQDGNAWGLEARCGGASPCNAVASRFMFTADYSSSSGHNRVRIVELS